MKEYIAFDSHKRYTLMEREDAQTGRTVQLRVNHTPGAIRSCLRECEKGTPVAVEATGNWYWIINEIEEAGLQPQLVHPRKAKLMMGLINKTDKLDVHGLNRLQRTGTLPTVWIPPAPLRDQRELTRTRLVLVAQRTRIKNRLHATLAKHGLSIVQTSDAFGAAARRQWPGLLEQLPEHTRWVSERLLAQVDFLDEQIQAVEKRLAGLLKVTPQMQLLQSLPGVGLILSASIAFELGDLARFPSAEHLASYAGTTPRVHASGDTLRLGRLRPDINRYLRWAYVEAANTVAVHHQRRPERHVSQLYQRLKERRGHAKACGAVARHLAEATFHILNRQENYSDPALRNRSVQTDVSASPS